MMDNFKQDPLNHEVKDKTIEIKSKVKINIADAIIAASAFHLTQFC